LDISFLNPTRPDPTHCKWPKMKFWTRSYRMQSTRPITPQFLVIAKCKISILQETVHYFHIINLHTTSNYSKWSKINHYMYRVVQKNAQSLMQRHIAICSRITRFSPKC